MKLYSYWRSSASYRVRIALNLKGLEVEQIPVNLVDKDQRSESYLATNPQGLVPTLVLDDGSVLTQSMAILEYLEETSPEPPLLPADPLLRARTRALANAIACDIHPLQNLRVLGYLGSELGQSQEQREDWYRHWVRSGLEAVDQQLSATPYCMGDSVTLADVLLVPQVFNARRFNCDLSRCQHVVRIVDHCNSLAAFIDASPEHQPDAPTA